MRRITEQPPVFGFPDADHGAVICAYDPTVTGDIGRIGVAGDPYAACADAAVLVVLTEWDEFRSLDFDKVASIMAHPAVVDCRNLLDRARVQDAGLSYSGIGLG